MSKDFDLFSFCKHVNATGTSPLTEAEATQLVKAYTDVHRLPNESSATAFARIYCGNDDVGLSFRKMVQVSKGIAHPHVAA